jgi:hypothetical protein
MNQVELDSYGRLRDISKAKLDKITAGGKAAMYRASDERLKQERAARGERYARLEPVHAALRSIFEKSPELANARGAVMALPRRESSPRLPHSALSPVPKLPVVNPGSLHLDNTAPHQTRVWIGEWGDNSLTTAPSADAATGTMSFFLAPGHEGSGSASCWAAIGQAYAPPKENGILAFSASLSYSWSAWWSSALWCEAAGNLWIGQVINRFDAEGTYIDTPVVTQNSLLSFNDYSLSEVQNPSGSSAGNTVSTSLAVEGDLFYECWIWAGGFAAANEVSTDNWSHAEVELSANVRSLVLELF